MRLILFSFNVKHRTPGSMGALPPRRAAALRKSGHPCDSHKCTLRSHRTRVYQIDRTQYCITDTWSFQHDLLHPTECGVFPRYVPGFFFLMLTSFALIYTGMIYPSSVMLVSRDLIIVFALLSADRAYMGHVIRCTDKGVRLRDTVTAQGTDFPVFLCADGFTG